MSWSPVSEMTREELIQELEQLREIVERLAASIPPQGDGPSSEELLAMLLASRRRGEFAPEEEGRQQTQDMIARKRREQDLDDSLRPATGREMYQRLARSGPPDEITLNTMQRRGVPISHADVIDRDTLQRYLTDLAKLGVRHGIKLEPDTQIGRMRIKPITEHQGGYLAERVDAGARVLASYRSGHEWDGPTDHVVGDDLG